MEPLHTLPALASAPPWAACQQVKTGGSFRPEPTQPSSSQLEGTVWGRAVQGEPALPWTRASAAHLSLPLTSWVADQGHVPFTPWCSVL